eukprot:1149906-Pelagomonas_calceolata.AAC.5
MDVAVYCLVVVCPQRGPGEIGSGADEVGSLRHGKDASVIIQGAEGGYTWVPKRAGYQAKRRHLQLAREQHAQRGENFSRYGAGMMFGTARAAGRELEQLLNLSCSRDIEAGAGAVRQVL